MAEKTGNIGSGQESIKPQYFKELQESFEKMNDHLVNELAGLQSQLNNRTTDWQDHLKSLSKAGDLLYGNLNKQLDFQSRLDKIVEESNKRQLDLAQYYEQKMGTFAYRGESPGDVKKKETGSSVKPVPTNQTERNERRSLLDRIKP